MKAAKTVVSYAHPAYLRWLPSSNSRHRPASAEHLDWKRGPAGARNGAPRPSRCRSQDHYLTLHYFIFTACGPFSDAGLLTDQCKAVGDGGQLIATRNVAGGRVPQTSGGQRGSMRSRRSGRHGLSHPRRCRASISAHLVSRRTSRKHTSP